MIARREGRDGSGKGDEGRSEEEGVGGEVDRGYYDRSGYFHEAPHLLDPDSSFHRYRVRKVLELYAPNDGDRVVDLGCGWGTFSIALGRRGARVVGVDFSARSLALCRARLREEPGLPVSLVQADAGATGLRGEEFEVVLAADLLEHLPPDATDRVVREARRILKPGGRFVIWTPEPGHFLERLRFLGVLRADPTHVDYKTIPRLTRLLEGHGFVVERAYHTESHLPVLRTVERLLLGLVPLLRRRIALVARKKRRE